MRHNGNHMLRRDREWHEYFNPPERKMVKCELCHRELQEGVQEHYASAYPDGDLPYCDRHGKLKRHQFEMITV